MKVWLTVVLIGCLMSVAYGADKEEVCQRWAAFAVELHREKNSGIIVNVSPNLEKFKKMVWEFVGTEEELRQHVINDCNGTRT